MMRINHHTGEPVVPHLQRFVFLATLGCFASIAEVRIAAQELSMEWKKLPSLNDPIGFAGQFVGVSHDRLLLVGGSNFPNKPVWDGGVKVWYRDVYALDDLNGEWKQVGTLDERYPVGYGVSLSTENGLLCIGGADATRHFDTVFFVNYDPEAPAGKQLSIRDLPSLPKAVGNCSGARVGDIVYVAGGTERPDSHSTMQNFWALDLTKLEAGWKSLEPWPGPARHLAVTASLGGAFYLMSGSDLSQGPEGKPVRHYLRDCYRYHPREGWTKLADLPQSITAGPGPAMIVDGEIVVFSGDDGKNVGFQPPDQHPGFPRTMWAYDAKQDRWRSLGETPTAPVVLPLVPWKDGYVAASGEVRPGVRTREVWFVKPK